MTHRFITKGMLVFSCILFFLPSSLPAAESGKVYIGLDGEFGHTTSTSAQAIRQGILIAADEINRAGGVLGGRKLALIEKDNRSVPSRGVQNVKELAANPDLVAVFCGKFSPVALELLPTIHQLGLPLLDPWAAIDAIVDNHFKPNYAFRLSLKDSWAIPVMMRHAKERKLLKIGMLTPRTSWGRSNVEAAKKYVAANPAMKIVDTRWYNWGDSTLAAQYKSIRQSGAQAVLLIANEGEGSILVKEVAGLPEKERLPLISHWGITGGDFPALTKDALQQVDFAVVQTFSFMHQSSPKADYVLTAAQKLFKINRREDIKSPVGLAHAYDLTHILAKAIDKAGSTDRKKIRNALEKLDRYDGLIKSYKQPFTPARHEALSPGDVFMARFNKDGVLIKIRK